ncbi:glutamine amidotransferase [Desulfosarcina alkanivorans]|uniref:Glutamine amidotransferase n=1 Tax=Desulfosarcina alkanivorans TaxID=571177 RepID=A0A5K7YX30_9BACT|nr:aminodeoxychorismate/anthranilate synthase component II [Desulfosarcina alkanivorans]BBO71651.1 glutamine amidotransferase [Desulfosarcina alkanivorans]
MILMIDNYDSFTYNLVQYFKQIGQDVAVKRNDDITVDDIAAMGPQAIVISPGPGRPSSAGVSLDAIRRFSGTIPLLGVCLGHQSIARAFGGKVVAARRLMHGKTSAITGDGKGVFSGIKQHFQAMRYHSLAVEKESLPDCLSVTATAEDGEIMGLRHRSHATEGIQFHPESIMTPVGKRLLRNFIKLAVP